MSDPKQPPPPEVAYYSGLDLGQAADFSAWVVVERTVPQVWDSTFQFAIPAGAPRYGVRHIHRWHLGTSYTQIVADLKAHYAKPPLQNSTLAIDRTGVGRGVSDMVSLAGVEARCRPYTITAGSKPNPGTVPKKELVAAIQVPLQERRLTFADALEMTDVLSKELEHFKVKVTESRNEQYEAWRERDHDDLVLALALALYAGRLGNIAFAVGDVPSIPKPPNLPPWMVRI